MELKYLTLIVEEASEVIQIICKIQRFGLNNYNPKNGKVNEECLISEIGDLLHCIDKLGIPEERILEAKKAKEQRLEVYGPEGSYLNGKSGRIGSS